MNVLHVILTCMIIILPTIILILYFKVRQLNKLLDLEAKTRTEKINELQGTQLLLKNAIREKQALLLETHHRFKNNMQLIMSLLNIYARKRTVEGIDEFIKKSQSSINTMVLIHQGLYQSQDLEEVDFQEYLYHLAYDLKGIYDYNTERMDLSIKADNFFFNSQTSIPLGLISVELLSNIFKHAIPDKNHNLAIEIQLKKIDAGFFELIISDNGIGTGNTNVTGKSKGLVLVQLLVEQIKGSFKIENANGTRCTITFKETNYFYKEWT